MDAQELSRNKKVAKAVAVTKDPVPTEADNSNNNTNSSSVDSTSLRQTTTTNGMEIGLDVRASNSNTSPPPFLSQEQLLLLRHRDAVVVEEEQRLQFPGYSHILSATDSNSSSDLASILGKSSIYGDRLTSAKSSAPPLSATSSVISSREKGELDAYEHDEETTESCHFCLRSIYPAQHRIARLPCCGAIMHFNCFRTRGWHHMPEELACPDCSRPALVTIDYSKEPDPPDITVGQEFTAKLSILIRKKGITTGLKQIYQAYRKGTGVENAFPEITKQEIIQSKLSLADLLTAGFNLDTIHDTMGVKKWEDLKALGFTEEQLPKLEDHVHSLRRLYDVDATTLRQDMGMTIKKLANLNLRSTTLRDLGFDAHTLCLMGLPKDGIKSFKNLTMANWVDHLNFRKVHLGILKIRRSDFDSPCLAPVSWNAEALREKLKLEEGEAIRIGLITPRDLEHGEWRRKFSTTTPSPTIFDNASLTSANALPHHNNSGDQNRRRQGEMMPAGGPSILPTPQPQGYYLPRDTNNTYAMNYPPLPPGHATSPYFVTPYGMPIYQSGQPLQQQQQQQPPNWYVAAPRPVPIVESERMKGTPVAKRTALSPGYVRPQYRPSGAHFGNRQY